MAPEWIWLIFVFAFGSCIGSFLNVVIYRLPREKSLITPPSACPACGKNIMFYDNIPLLSWLVLRAKCRFCKARISPRYFIVELLTALLFVAVYILYFVRPDQRFEINGFSGFAAFTNGGWLVFIMHMILLSSFLAASAIDLELWVIPLGICWFTTAAAFIISPFISIITHATPIEPNIIGFYSIFRVAPSAMAALSAGAIIGLILAIAGLITGIIKKSYDFLPDGDKPTPDELPGFPHRKEILKEIIFVGPVIICAFIAFTINKKLLINNPAWLNFTQLPAVKGLTISIMGYFSGCTIVWATRILGTLGFGKEAMGLGDVHLMGAAGAVIGPVFVIIAFFVAPFFGLAWALQQLIFKKTRQIPYGPFLSLGTFAVMIFHNYFRTQLDGLFLF